jgi:hypothetical protein
LNYNNGNGVFYVVRAGVLYAGQSDRPLVREGAPQKQERNCQNRGLDNKQKSYRIMRMNMFAAKPDMENAGSSKKNAEIIKTNHSNIVKHIEMIRVLKFGERT